MSRNIVRNRASSVPLVRRVVAWGRTTLFSSLGNSLVSALLLLAALALLARFAQWAIIDAVWSAPPGDSGPCRVSAEVGACWALVGEKYRFMLFATYPYAEQWRPALACAVLVVLYVVSAIPAFWSRSLLLVWGGGIALVLLLMWGGVAHLTYVPSELWGGLPVTLLLATIAIILALPLGVLIALGRRADELPVIKLMCVGYVELVRGVPLVSLLFMASFVFPLFLPDGASLDKLLRAQVALILFSAAYFAEVIRGGLQSVVPGQSEAASALGLGYWRTHALVVLPQALRNALPSLVNTGISVFKSTSLVLVVGIFDLLSAGKASIVDPIWQGFGLEMFMVISMIYFIFCFGMSQYSKYIERRTQKI